MGTDFASAACADEITESFAGEKPTVFYGKINMKRQVNKNGLFGK